MVVWARNFYPIVTGSCRKQMQMVKNNNDYNVLVPIIKRHITKALWYL